MRQTVCVLKHRIVSRPRTSALKHRPRTIDGPYYVATGKRDGSLERDTTLIDCIAVEDMSDHARNFECIVCQEIVRDCRTTSCCSALLCGECVDKNHITDCPNCRKAGVEFPKSVAVQRLANALVLECQGCGLTHKHEDNHSSWCPQGYTKCHYEFLGCTWQDRRRLLQAHLAEKHVPRCSARHPLVKAEVHTRLCDICQQTITGGMVAMQCLECDYDECPGCFLHRPIRSLGRECRLGRDIEADEDEEAIRLEDSSHDEDDNDNTSNNMDE